MARFKNPLRHIKLVYKRSSNVTKIVVLCAIVICTAALLILGGAIRDAEARTDALKAQASRLEQENNRLSALIDSLGTVAGIEQIAREELGLVDPDSVIIDPS
ncbi:MAG: septum formation initiator family protein [Oscillospiraceae bacterium]|nr:septum formation initiator family protein [Oscillospiraceae bacterium]